MDCLEACHRFSSKSRSIKVDLYPRIRWGIPSTNKNLYRWALLEYMLTGFQSIMTPPANSRSHQSPVVKITKSRQEVAKKPPICNFNLRR
ncbi:Protein MITOFERRINLIKE 1, chloroplastic [Gossypium arboreum]|uniref:Protein MITOFERRINLIKE 1, chloroplastic n=1 Tax=Gossypium arboreum TaxID=29729 RepID=A0A0B0MXQ1_GOSAR|nr:Protein MITOFERRINLIKE 1, chloroplastic [Gossypium arboreum]